MKHKLDFTGKKEKIQSWVGRTVRVERVDRRVQGSGGRGGGDKYGLNTVYEILNDLIKILFL